MHITVLATKRGQAVERITNASKKLAEKLNLSPALVDGLTPYQVKDPTVKEMRRLEGIADLLDAVAIAQGIDLSLVPDRNVPAISVTDVTEGLPEPTTYNLAVGNSEATVDDTEPKSRKRRGN